MGGGSSILGIKADLLIASKMKNMKKRIKGCSPTKTDIVRPKKNRSSLENNSSLKDSGFLQLLKDETGDEQTPLMHAAALLPHTSARDLLSDKHTNAHPTRGDTEATLQRKGSAHEIVKVLLEESKLTPAQVNCLDNHRNTALHFAAENDNAKVVDQLLAAKADPSLRNIDGKTPGNLCHSEYVREILEHVETAAFSVAVNLSPRNQIADTDAMAATIETHAANAASATHAAIQRKVTVHDGIDPYTALVSVCIDGAKAEKFSALLASGVDVNKADSKGTTPLMHATWHEHEDIIHMLLKSKADPCLKNHRLNSALHFAYEKENEPIIHSLLEAGATAVMRDSNELGLIPADMASSEYLRCEDPTEQTPQPVAATTDKGSHYSMLMLVPLSLSSVCKDGHLETVKALIERKANVNEQNNKKSTPLMHAVWSQHMEIVETLLDASADPNQQNAMLNTAVHFAYEINNEDIVNVLLAYGGMHALYSQNAKGKTPMDMANDEYLRCESILESPGHEAAAAYVAKHETAPTPTIVKQPSGVIKACKNDLPDTVYLLLQKKADPNKKDSSGTTPLMHATRYKNVKIAKILLAAKADPNLSNKRKNTALHFAFETNNRLMVKLLVQHGGQKSSKKKNSSGKTPQQLTTKAYLRSLHLAKLAKKSSLIRNKNKIDLKTVRA